MFVKKTTNKRWVLLTSQQVFIERAYDSTLSLYTISRWKKYLIQPLLHGSNIRKKHENRKTIVTCFLIVFFRYFFFHTYSTVFIMNILPKHKYICTFFIYKKHFIHYILLSIDTFFTFSSPFYDITCTVFFFF